MEKRDRDEGVSRCRADWAPTESPDSPHHPRRYTRTEIIREIIDWIKYLAIAVVVGLLLTTFVIQRNQVIGRSMYPTMDNGNQVLVQKLSRLWDGLQYGDIITVHGARVPGASGSIRDDIVKRVVGRPGDRIEIKDGAVYRNGEPIEELYLPAGTVTEPIHDQWSDVTLGADEYYVLGDNRPGSRDSRDFGPVPHDAVIGELLIRIYPLKEIGPVR